MPKPRKSLVSLDATPYPVLTGGSYEKSICSCCSSSVRKSSPAHGGLRPGRSRLDLSTPACLDYRDFLESKIEELLELPGVTAIFDDGVVELETVASPQFIGADSLWDELGGPDRAGEGIIVANIDSGVWPESPSFSDPDPAGNPLPSPPLRWRGTACEFGSDTPGDVPFG